jgi:phytoene synthase
MGRAWPAGKGRGGFDLMMAASGGPSLCAQEVRRGDGERYLTALFAPVARREDLFALYAFNLAIASTREMVSEPLMGEIRLQWWRDALAAIHAGRPPGQPVAAALGDAIGRHRLARAPFEALIDAREFDLMGEPPADLDALEGYAEASSAPLMGLALDILGAPGGPAREAGRHVGIAWALTGLLRAVPAHARAGRRYLPRATDERGIVAEIVSMAQARLLEARALRRDIPGAALPVLLLAPLADRYLRRLRRVRHDPHAAGIEMSGPARQWHLLRYAAFTRY